MVLADVRRDPLTGGEPTDQLIGRQGGDCEYMVADVSRRDDCERLVVRAGEHTDGEGIFIEELRGELERRGVGFPRVAGETHALAGHDEAAQRAALEDTLDR